MLKRAPTWDWPISGFWSFPWNFHQWPMITQTKALKGWVMNLFTLSLHWKYHFFCFFLLDLSLSLQNQPTGQRLLGKLLIFLNFDSTTEWNLSCVLSFKLYRMVFFFFRTNRLKWSLIVGAEQPELIWPHMHDSHANCQRYMRRDSHSNWTRGQVLGFMHCLS